MTRTIQTGGRFKLSCKQCGRAVDELKDDMCESCYQLRTATKAQPRRGRCNYCGETTRENRDFYCDCCTDCERKQELRDKERLIEREHAKVEEGKKFDDDKNPLSLLPFESLDGVGLVLRHGAVKYAAHNWRAGMSWSRLISALLRHIFAFARGEDIDPESGLPHLDHAACCILFLSSYQKTKSGTDDRFKVEIKDGQ